MTSLARKYDESKLSARLGILVGLVFQLVDGLLSRRPCAHRHSHSP